MRDIFFLTVLPFMLYCMYKRPFIALGMWIWTALFFPNGWLYGLASGIRYNMLFAAITIGGYLIMQSKPKTSFGSIGGMVLLFFAWTSMSTLLTNANPVIVNNQWIALLKIVVLFMFVVLVVEKKLHIDFVLWCVVLSIGFFAGLEALKWVGSGGGHKIEGLPSHVLSDRNELAVAFVMLLPICYYLLTEYGSQSRILRIGMLGLMGLVVAAIIGTQSRGGMIALLGVFGYMFMKSDRKFPLMVLVTVLVLVLSHFVSDEWSKRMDTINNADEDASFMGRVVAWKMSFILALHHPMFGGGFKAIEYFPLWSSMIPEFDNYTFFYTGDARPNPVWARAAHSIYFQVLGDHGFAGLGIYLTMMLVAFRKAGALAKRARLVPNAQWISTLATMLQLCLFSFGLGGAALSFAYFDLAFAIMGIIQALESRLLPAAAAAAAKEKAAA